jgi:hypothetical protein
MVNEDPYVPEATPEIESVVASPTLVISPFKLSVGRFVKLL